VSIATALGCQRHLFSIPESVHFLNCAYMGPLPRSAEEAGVRGVRRRAVPTDFAASDFFEDSDRVRGLFARAIGSDEPQRVAIQPSASYGVAVAAKNLPCSAGQSIVVAGEQFPSNVYAWRRLAGASGARLRTVASPVAEPPRAEAWNAAILDAIDASTAIVALPQVHWTDGTRFDLEAIGARARAVGAALVVDATQSIGALDFDLQRIRPDAVVCSAYKWLLGPYALAFGWFGPRFDHGVPLEETWIGREGSEDFQGLVDYRDAYQPGALRYDMGERSNFVSLPMAIASMTLVADWGTERIQRYCEALMAAPLLEAQELGFRVEPRAGRGAHLFGLRLPAGLDLRQLHEALGARGVYASLRGSALRVSPNMYNDDADVEALMEVLRAAVR